MPEFDAVGRDVAAAADSTFDAPVAGAVKALWAYAGFTEGDNPNHLWNVSAAFQSDRWTISATVKDANVYVAPAYPSVPATDAELKRSAVEEAPEEATSVEPPVATDETPPVAEPDAPAA